MSQFDYDKKLRSFRLSGHHMFLVEECQLMAKKLKDFPKTSQAAVLEHSVEYYHAYLQESIKHENP